MNKIKNQVFIETLEQAITNVEMTYNHLIQLHQYSMPSSVIEKDYTKTVLNLEIALAGYSIILRKMNENHMLEYDKETRVDINSLIHSNRFDYSEDSITVYSQRGKESIDLKELLDFGKQIIESFSKN